MEDYSSFIKEVFNCFADKTPGEISDVELSDELNQRFKIEIDRYLQYYDSFNEHVNEKYHEKIRKLIIVRILARDIWDEVFNRYNYKTEKYDDKKYRISAIGKIQHRILLITDENINLFRNGMGLSILSNCRMMLESYAYAVYINCVGETEADRFQDYSLVQSSQINESGNGEQLFDSKYQSDFYKPYGWVTEKEDRTLSKLVSKIEDEKYIKYYKILSNFVHASPYSIEVAHALGKPGKKMEEHHFPLTFNDTLKINIKILSDYINLVIDSFIIDDKESYFFALNAVLRWC